MKSDALRDLQSATRRLRQAAQAATTSRAGQAAWGPRDVLAHITLWAVQAAHHFARRLPPLDYGADGGWSPEMADTFDRVFEMLAGPGTRTDRARAEGWEVVARQGITLPLT